MAAPYLLSPQALADVDGIADYISKDSPRQARRVIEELFLAMDRLAEMPEIGHRREDLASKRYRFWPFYSYVVVYEPGRKPLWIVRVLGGARLSGLEELQGLLE